MSLLSYVILTLNGKFECGGASKITFLMLPLNYNGKFVFVR